MQALRDLSRDLAVRTRIEIYDGHIDAAIDSLVIDSFLPFNQAQTGFNASNAQDERLKQDGKSFAYVRKGNQATLRTDDATPWQIQHRIQIRK